MIKLCFSLQLKRPYNFREYQTLKNILLQKLKNILLLKNILHYNDELRHIGEV